MSRLNNAIDIGAMSHNVNLGEKINIIIAPLMTENNLEESDDIFLGDDEYGTS